MHIYKEKINRYIGKSKKKETKDGRNIIKKIYMKNSNATIK